MKRIDCMIVGLTGGIASGKTTVASILIEKGYRVIDSDNISREVIEPGKPAYKDIIDFFGESILNRDESINRKILGDLVFSDDKLLQVLNNITHPYIFKELINQINSQCRSNRIIFVDIPLLFERYEELKEEGIVFDEIWLVYVDEKVQLERLMLRNNLKEKQAIDRINAQIPLEIKRENATRLIDNNGDFEQLRRNVEGVLGQFI